MRGFRDIPETTKIAEIIEETPDIKTFVIPFSDSENIKPGQFLEVYIPNYWEIPISVADVRDGLVYLTIQRVGKVTGALFRMKTGDTIGLRGPYGRPWPLEKFKEKNVLLIVGGLGLAPLKMVIENLKGDNLTVIIGARRPDYLLYREFYDEWKAHGVKMSCTVDYPAPDWKGNIGVVTTLLKKEYVNWAHYALVAGPPIMMKYTIKILKDFGMDSENVYLTLENHMKCGIGLCGHCRIGDKYVCVDGPIFSLKEIEELEEKAAGEVL